MTRFIQQFWQDEDGASAAEYALILAVASAGIVAGATFLAGEIQDAMEEVACIIQNPETNTDSSCAA
jgi:pilus assembly protein Flp/PilA